MDVTIRKGFTEKTCGNCGVIFFIPDELENECFHNGKSWTCPNGHTRVYKESESAKYQRLYEAEKQARQREASVGANAIESARRLREQVEKLQTKKKKTGKGK
jgi:hypothetical protein